MTSRILKINAVVLTISLVSFTDRSKDKIWIEKDGIIVIEAEFPKQTLSNEGWTKGDTLRGFFGDGYVVWRGTPDWGPESRPYDSFLGQSVLTYHFRIKNPGVYNIKIRNYHMKKDGDNDVWTSVDGGEWGKTYDWQTREWTPDERGAWAKRKLEAGDHRVELAGRSKGFCIDRIIIFKDGIAADNVAQLPASKRKELRHEK